MRIGIVAPSDASLVWTLAGPLLEKSTEWSGGRYDLNAIYEQIKSGEQTLWLVSERPREPIAAFTTRVLVYPLVTVLSCQFCGGQNRMDEWIVQCDEILNRFARDAGCTMIELAGRAGWSRKLPEPWLEEARLYRRSVTHEQGRRAGTADDDYCQ